MRKVVISLVVLSMLAGCAVAELGHLAYLLAANGKVGASWNSSRQIEPIEGQHVYAASFFTPDKSDTTKCNADGVVVDYARDWDVIDDQTGDVIFKASTEIYGQAVLLYYMECNDGFKSDVLLTDERRQLIGPPLKLDLFEGIRTTDFHTATEFRKPRWMSQVLKTIQNEALTNPAARKFLEHVPVK